MKKIIAFMILMSLLLIMACEVKEPVQPDLDTPAQRLLFRKMVTIGNSITMGIQSAGIREDFQMNNYPYLVAKQAGISGNFQQPLVSAPGIAGNGMLPLELENGTIVSNPSPIPADQLATLFKNSYIVKRPYDNLGISGATLHDVLYTTTSANSTDPTNPFYDAVLRNPTLGNLTILEQAILLNPSLVIIWIGNNPILGAALAGSSDAKYIVDQDVFASEYTNMLNELRKNKGTTIIAANIPNVTDIPYVNSFDHLYLPTFNGDTTFVLFDATMQPINFNPAVNPPMYIPLRTQEADLAHLLIPTLTAYQQGIGVPDSAKLVQLGMPAAQASQIIAGMIASGLTPTTTPIPGYMSLTKTEATTIETAIAGYNTSIATACVTYSVPVIPMNYILYQLNVMGIGGVSGNFALFDPANTGFSLDGVHPNNAGHAIIANVLIATINELANQLNLDLEIAPVDINAYKGQYLQTNVNMKMVENAVSQVKKMYGVEENSSY